MQLGLPTEQAWQYAKDLQEYYSRVSVALQTAKNPQGRPGAFPGAVAPNTLPPNQHQLNSSMLQNVIKNYPHIDFTGITSEMITNFPPQRFEARIRAYITERTQAVNNSTGPGNAPHMPSRTPVPSSVMVNPPALMPAGDPANNGQMQRARPTITAEDVLKLHDQCRAVWRQAYEGLRE